MIEIEYVSTSKLKPYDGNPRKMEPSEMLKLRRSLKDFGFVDPIIVRKSDNLVIGGHQRLDAAKEEGIMEVPVVYVEVSDDKAGLMNIALNKISGDWDYSKLGDLFQEIDTGIEDIEQSGFSTEEIEGVMNGLDTASGDITEDELPEPPEEVISKLGDLWIMGNHRLLCGDSTSKEDVERLMGGEKADTVFTSPPYAVGIDYGKYDDTIDNLRKMLPLLSALWIKLVKPGGYAVINFGDIISARGITKTKEPCEYPMALEYWPVFRADDWVLWSRRVWCKPCAGTGSMQCISSNRAATNWENIWTWKSSGKQLHNKQTTGDFVSQNGWIDSTHGHKLGVGLKDHGAGMPVCVAAYGIGVHSFVKGIVHEPFSGTGTTIIAAEQLNRKCYAMELEPKYVDISVKRWENLTGKTAVLEKQEANYDR